MSQESILSDPSLELITTLLYSRGLPEGLPKPPTAPLAEPDTEAASHCYLLSYGLDRLRAAAADFGWSKVIDDLNPSDRATSLASQVEAHVIETHGEVALDPSQRFIVRIAFKRDGVASLMSAPRPTVAGIPYYPLSLLPPEVDHESEVGIPGITLHLDPGHVESSLFTKHKTSYRGKYNEARGRVGFDESVGFAVGEALLRNERGEITGGSMSTVYFWRDGCWITPTATTGCKLGVSRRWALEHAGVKEGVVMAEDIREGESVRLSSAVGGFRRGKVTLRPRESTS